ncbi:hypothetical protein [Thermomonospora cellulosilytica]|uniref:GIY-YIG domain-containing protein n=1 Tax=Thermomonospora cellulosilytica TaxID=1411118 RepID=A0A7W3MYG8_9ACTN|nr:hypothetical protein [Thermomonospora cellulosilytica]MBA9004225.1 hypothetical protein [Thermomonospora cellulosilytica]
MSNLQADRRRDTDRFYALLDELAERVGGPRRLKDCTEASGWPQYGVEFFLEDGQVRAGGGGLRVVRVGSHALRTTSKATFWTRLAQHRGPVSGANAGVGNHRGSVFRQHVGSALLETGDWPAEVAQTWGQKDVSPVQRAAERPLERAVSDHIGAMPLLWLDVPDLEQRKSIRANAIALLSQRTGGIHPTTPGWLGLHAKNDNVRTSGLWNSDFVDDPYDPSFLDAMEACVKAM